jgi:endonuclease YncB( thermonuclease family)
MKKLLFTLLFAFSATVAANPYDYKVLKVVDGDTVDFEAKFLPAPLKPVLKLRILGIDTPEKGARALCPKEAELGAKATEFAKTAVANAKTIQIKLVSWDKFGGRVLGDLILDGVNYKDMIIKAGLAREYYGEKKSSWCN